MVAGVTRIDYVSPANKAGLHCGVTAGMNYLVDKMQVSPANKAGLHCGQVHSQ